MTRPPRTPPTGAPQHRDYAGRSEITRPGLHVARRPSASELDDTIDLDDTHDEATERPARAHSRTPISVPRAETPDDDVLARAVESIRAEDPCWNFAREVKAAIDSHAVRMGDLERVAAEHASDRKLLADLDKRTSPPRWRRWGMVIGKALGAGAMTMALGLAARALIAHGNSTAESRAEHARVMSHDRAVRALQRALALRDRWLAFLAGKLGLQFRLDDDNTPQDDDP